LAICRVAIAGVLAGSLAVHAPDLAISRLQAEETLPQQLGYEFQITGSDLQDVGEAGGASAQHSAPPRVSAYGLLTTAKLMEDTCPGGP
jgi:hypothetical protein